MQRDVYSDSGRSLNLSQKILKAFIAEYKASPELWNPLDPDYTNRYKKARAHDRLLPILKKLQSDATRYDVRYKINTLRTNYKKVYGKMKAAEAEGREYVPTSWTYNQLKFLDVIHEPDCQAESNQNESEERENSGEEYEDDNIESVEPNPIEVKLENSHSLGNYEEEEVYEDVSLNEDPKPVKKKPKTARYLPKPQRRRPEVRPERSNYEASTTAIEPIALVWSSKLQTLRPRQRFLAEKAINDILFEASLNKLQTGTMVMKAGRSSVSYKKSHSFSEYQEEYLDEISTDDDA